MVSDRNYQNAINILWVDRCEICVLQNEKEARTGKTRQKWTSVFSDLPCRLSFKSVVVPNETDSAARTAQETKLFINKDVTVPPGSKIIVAHEGVKREYAQSGVSAVYSFHQEIPIEIREEWA